MIIEVTQEDIDKGKRHDCEECAVALAVKRTPLAEQFVGIGPQHLVLREATPKSILPLPEEIIEFIAAFDRGEAVQPVTFDIPVPA